MNSKAPDQMPVVRYDLVNAAGVFEERHWKASNKPVLDAEGNVLYILHTSSEFTEQVIAERSAAAMREIEKKYSLFMQAPVAFCIIKAPENTLELANEELLRILGRTPDMIGKPFFEAIPEATDQGLAELLDRVRNTGKASDAREFPITLVIGGKQEVRYYNFVCQPYYEDPGDREAVGVFSVWHDVTEQVMARRKVEESEQQVRSFIESSHHPIGVYIGREMRIQFANQALKNSFGKGDDIVGKLYRDVLPELENQEVFKQLDEVYTTGIPFQAKNHRLELVVGGELRAHFFDLSLTPLFNTAGEVYSIINTGADVTELNYARERAAESESRFRNLVKQAPVAIALTRGQDVVIESINTPMLRLMGKGKEEAVIGKRMVEALPEMKDQPILSSVKSVVETGEPFRGSEVPASLRVGEKLEQHFLNASYSPLIEEGIVTGVIHVVTDVTEQVIARKKVEENEEALRRFKFMADQARDAFVLMRADGSFAYLNPKALEAWGYKEEEAGNIRVPDVDPVHQEELFSQLFAKAQQETIPQFETLHKRKDGHIFPVEVNVVGLKLDGEPHLFALARDITERKRNEEALEQKNNQLTRINNDLDNFIYTASHDLKAPIFNIEGLLSLLSYEFSTGGIQEDEPRQIMNMMQQSVERFKKTIESLTDVVRLQQENEEEAVLIELPAIIQEVRLDLKPFIEASGAQLELNLEECPAVRFSEKNLRSVLYNLISNAVKYRSPDREPRIQINCGSTPYHHVLTVTDNGLGLERTNELFTMFKRFHDHVEGTGIGLYMVKKMVENAGGRKWRAT